MAAPIPQPGNPDYREPGHSHTISHPCTPEGCTGHGYWHDVEDGHNHTRPQRCAADCPAYNLSSGVEQVMGVPDGATRWVRGEDDEPFTLYAGGEVRMPTARYAEVMREAGWHPEDEHREPSLIRGFREVRYQPRDTSGVAGELILVTDTGLELDISGAIFGDRVALRTVGDDAFGERGLDVTLVLSHIGDPVPDPTAVPQAIAVEPIPRPEPTPDTRERFVRTRGAETRAMVFTDDEDGNEKDVATLPMPLMRELLIEAGYERDYVRDDVELDRVRRRAAESDGSVASAPFVPSNPTDVISFALAPERPSWDTMSVEDAQELPRFPNAFGSPTTPRGHLLLQLWNLRWNQRRLVDTMTEHAESRDDAEVAYDDAARRMLELRGAVHVLDNVGR